MTKKEKILLMVLVIVLAIGGVIIWWTLAPSEEEVIEGLAPVALEKKAEEMMRKMPDILDFSTFEHPWFEKAKIHGDLPVEAGVTGRDNPFKPY